MLAAHACSGGTPRSAHAHLDCFALHDWSAAGPPGEQIQRPSPVLATTSQSSSIHVSAGIVLPIMRQEVPLFSSTRANESEIWLSRSGSLRPDAQNGGR